MNSQLSRLTRYNWISGYPNEKKLRGLQLTGSAGFLSPAFGQVFNASYLLVPYRNLLR
ncbi:hypothetical protein SAMN05216412_11161 [Nitrosospira multiformis]|uniref:Uncharacterized protein n=1 Tax=Nitrosospira multiformis TaxID=1231 RepID=A0A1I0G3E0_9PROT|nr:hypothetical protein SAMN05216412_11161 [Nitrosospira multiformis]